MDNGEDATCENCWSKYYNKAGCGCCGGDECDRRRNEGLMSGRIPH